MCYQIAISGITSASYLPSANFFRIIPTAVHTLEDVNYTLNAFADVKKKLAEGKYDADVIPDMAIW